MANGSDIKTIILKVNGEDAEKKLEDLNAQLTEAKKKKEDLDKKYSEGESWSSKDIKEWRKLHREIDKCERQLDKMDATADQVTDTLEKLDKAAPRNLEKTLQSMQKALKKTERGTAEYEKLTKAIRDTKTALKDVKDEQGEILSMSERFRAWGDKWMGIATTIYGAVEAISGIKATASEATQAYAEMQEAQADVRKYTGLTADAVERLNEKFKDMDTRTPREKLNALAADAGRLGITAEKDIMDFVDAANQINVALGEDLGEDAVKNIGKLAQLFGEDQRVGLKTAMLATGSIINELGQTSSASEGYLMEFTARLAGMGKQAGMTQADIMSLGSVLDQAMVNAEESSTAVSNLIQKIYREPAKMAKVVGLDVKKFTELVKEDANEALLQFLGAVNKMGGMTKIAPMLGELQMTGAGVSKAISTLAGQIDKVRATQEQATSAFAEATSVGDEYNAANNTIQAGMEKARKRVHDLKVELGEQLLPIMQSGLSIGSASLKVGAKLLDFVGQHMASIVAASAVLAAFTMLYYKHVVALKLSAAWTATTTAVQNLGTAAIKACSIALTLFTKGLRAARLQWHLLNTTMKANVFGLVASLITAAVVAVVELTKKEKDLTDLEKQRKAMAKDMADVEQEANKNTAKEIGIIELLTDIIHDNNVEVGKRREAVDKLKDLVPKYYAELDEEGRITRENTKAVKDYTEAIKNQAMAKAIEDKMTDLSGQKLNNDLYLQHKQAMYNKRKKDIEDWKRQNADLAQYVEWEKDGSVNYNPSVAGDPAHRLAKDKVAYEGLNIDTDKGYQRMRELEVEYRKAYGKLSRLNRDYVRDLERYNAQQTISEGIDNRIKELSDVVKKNKDLFKNLLGDDNNEDDNKGGGKTEDEIREEVKRIQNAANLLKLQKRLDFETGEIDRQEYNLALIQIDEESYQKQRDVYTKYSDEWLDAENKRLDAAAKQKKQFHDYSLKQIEVDTAEEKAKLYKRYASGEISEKEYQDKLTEIKLKALERRSTYLLQYAPDTEEQLKAKAEYENALEEDKLNKRKSLMEQAAQFEQEYNQKTIEEKKQFELSLLEELVKQKIIDADKEKEYREGIDNKYKKKQEEEDKKGKGESPLSGGSMDPLSTGVISLGTAIDNLQKKLKDGKAGWEDYAAVAVASLGMISSIASSASQLIQANISVETEKVNRRYDSEIKAAGKNSKKAKQLEEQRQKEIAKIKNKYAAKAMAMEIAAAVAQTAVAAINAYASASKVSWILGPIAAAAAVASGMIQIAAIKKQHQASKGYYHGGFTGGSDYKREAGVVHEGEFVGNHMAVQNPYIRRVFNVIDFAQRNNRVGQLTDRDISRSITAPQQMISSITRQPAPVVVHETEQTTAALERLNDNIEQGIHAVVAITDIHEKQKMFDQMQKRKKP